MNATAGSNEAIATTNTRGSGFITEVCYRFPKPCSGPQQESNPSTDHETISVVPGGCYDQVCFRQADIGWTGVAVPEDLVEEVGAVEVLVALNWCLGIAALQDYGGAKVATIEL